MCVCDYSTGMDVFNGKLGKSSVDGDSPHWLGKPSNSLSSSAGHKAATENQQTHITGLSLTLVLQDWGAWRHICHPVGLGTISCSPKVHRARSQGSQCSVTTGIELIPVFQVCPPPPRPEATPPAGALSACSAANTHFPRGGLEKIIHPLGKAILRSPKQHVWLLPRGVSLKLGSEQLPVPPGPPQKGAGHHRGICSIPQQSREHSSSLIPRYIPATSPILFWS